MCVHETKKRVKSKQRKNRFFLFFLFYRIENNNERRKQRMIENIKESSALKPFK